MSRTNPTVAIVGSIIVDLAVTTPRVPLTGENILAHTFKKGPGGKGANAAAAVALMGGAITPDRWPLETMTLGTWNLRLYGRSACPLPVL